MVVWSSCKHDNILEFTGYYLGDDFVTAYLISPYMRNGNARDFLAKRKPPNDERLKLVRDTMDGLDYLHNRNPPVIHGDLKAMMTDNFPYVETPSDAKVIVFIYGGTTPEPNPPPQDWPDGLLELARKCWSMKPNDRPDTCACVASLHSVPKVMEYLQEEGLQALETCFILGSQLRDDPNHTLPETTSSSCHTSKTAVLLPPDDSTTESLKNVVVKGLRLHDLPSFSSRFESFKNLAQDMASWTAFEHENILKFVGYSVSADFGTVSLITPYMVNGNVMDYIHREEVYYEGILKLFNILVNDNGKALLGDYGLGASAESSLTGKTPGASARWSSPEVISGEPATVQSDMWSWACVVLQMITGDRPYPDIEEDDEIVSILASDKPNRRTPEPLSEAAVPGALLELLQQCWDFDPWSRADAWICMDTLDAMPDTQPDPYQSDREEVLKWLDHLIMDEFVPVLEDVLRGYTSTASPAPPAPASNAPILRIKDILSMLREPITVTRDEIGETLRELNDLVEGELPPQPNNQKLRTVLDQYQGLIAHYPDDSHPRVVDFLLRSVGKDLAQHGECLVPPKVFAQAVGRWPVLSQGDETLLELLPYMAATKMAFSEMPLYDPKAIAILEQTIEVCRRAFTTADHQKLSKRFLAASLVEHSQWLCRTGDGQNGTIVVGVLREAINIYEDLVKSSTDVVEDWVVGEGLADALGDLVFVLRRRGEIREAMKVEAKLIRLKKQLDLRGRDRKT
ncbi:hypothetical protein FRC05_002793 [Tulasnella sp. 425]|nr:hypothetical protein FRC05_002793 [Tulasnella sp. 425]